MKSGPKLRNSQITSVVTLRLQFSYTSAFSLIFLRSSFYTPRSPPGLDFRPPLWREPSPGWVQLGGHQHLPTNHEELLWEITIELAATTTSNIYKQFEGRTANPSCFCLLIKTHKLSANYWTLMVLFKVFFRCSKCNQQLRWRSYWQVSWFLIGLRFFLLHSWI